jgi:hypothetical protein
MDNGFNSPSETALAHVHRRVHWGALHRVRSSSVTIFFHGSGKALLLGERVQIWDSARAYRFMENVIAPGSRTRASRCKRRERTASGRPDNHRRQLRSHVRCSLPDFTEERKRHSLESDCPFSVACFRDCKVCLTWRGSRIHSIWPATLSPFDAIAKKSVPWKSTGQQLSQPLEARPPSTGSRTIAYFHT